MTHVITNEEIKVAFTYAQARVAHMQENVTLAQAELDIVKAETALAQEKIDRTKAETDLSQEGITHAQEEFTLFLAHPEHGITGGTMDIIMREVMWNREDLGCSCD